MEEQFNKEANGGWRFAADGARITDERAGSEDQKHTSAGVFFFLRSKATWELLLERKKEQLRQSQETTVELHRFGYMYVEVYECLQHTSSTRRDGPPRDGVILEPVL